MCLMWLCLFWAEAIDNNQADIQRIRSESPVTDIRELRELERRIADRLPEFVPIRVHSASSHLITGRAFDLVAEFDRKKWNCTIHFAEEPLKQELHLNCTGLKTKCKRNIISSKGNRRKRAIRRMKKQSNS